MYKRSAEPRYNIITFAVPVKKDDGSVSAILIMQTRLDSFFSWAKNIHVGDTGFVYFVDPRGHVAAHPAHPSDADIVDFSSVPVVQKALAGARGVEVGLNPVDKVVRLSAYAPVSRYGWGAIVAQDATAAFAARDAVLRRHMVVFGFATISVFILSFFLARAFGVIQRSRRIISEEKAKTGALLQSVGEGLIAADSGFRILVMNDAAEALLGWDNIEVIGKRIGLDVPEIQDGTGEVVPPERQPFRLALAARRRVSVDLTSNIRYYYVRKDKTKFPVAITAAPVMMEGKPIGVITVFRDISKEIELDLAKSEFISLASHELKSLPSAFRWGVETLVAGDAGKLTKKQREILEPLADLSSHMIAIVDALLNASRMELGTFIVNPEPVRIGEVAKSVVDEFQKHVKEKRLVVREIYAKNAPVISLDENLIKIVLRNLISNAIKYTPNGGEIRVTVDRDKESGGVRVMISDTGVGIPKVDQKKIFGKMFRAMNVRDTAEGTGFGLYLAKAIVDLAHGSIAFVSEEKKGTTFTVVLPPGGMKKKEGTSKITGSSAV
jgi:PAS domain S-box-containing protein